MRIFFSLYPKFTKYINQLKETTFYGISSSKIRNRLFFTRLIARFRRQKSSSSSSSSSIAFVCFQSFSLSVSSGTQKPLPQSFSFNFSQSFSHTVTCKLRGNCKLNIFSPLQLGFWLMGFLYRTPFFIFWVVHEWIP
jgi:hypothetical protein